MSSFPLSPFENKARIHAHLGFFAYLVGLPIGVLLARYLRTFTNGWFWPHSIVNFLMVGPLVFATFALGYQTTTLSLRPHFADPHQKVGLALLILYLVQVFLGMFIHFLKFQSARWPTGRAPQNYFHAILGLAIIALASWQTHYGLFTEWAIVTGNVHPVGVPCKHFWLAIVIIVWALYGLGLGLVPRQYKQERIARQPKTVDGGEAKDGAPQRAA